MPVNVDTLFRHIAGLESRLAMLERNQRVNNIGNATIENGTLLINDGDGNQVQALGLQPDGTYAHVVSVSTAPLAPSAPSVTPGPLGLLVAWDGTMSDGSTPLSDFSYIQVHLATSLNFTPSSATMVGTLHEAGSTLLTGLSFGVTYFCALVAINTSDNIGPASAEVSGTVLPVPGAAVTIGASQLGYLGVLNSNPYFWGADGTGWVGTSGAGTFQVSTSLPAGIPYAFGGQFTSNGTPGGIIEAFAPFPVAATTPGTQYLLTCWVYSQDTSVTLGFQWTLNGTPVSASTSAVTVTANTWTQITTVQTAPTSGVNQGYIVVQPTTPVNGHVLYATALTALPQVPGGLIQAGTITVSQLAAGIVYAGIVNGTTITGATIIADGASGEFLVYSGSPTTGNLVATVSPIAGTDSHSNSYKAGITVYDTSSTSYVQMVAGSPALLNVGTGDSAEATPGHVSGFLIGSGATRQIITDLRAARMTGQNSLAVAEIQLQSPSADLTTFQTQVSMVAQDGTNSNAVTVAPTNTTIASPLLWVTCATDMSAFASPPATPASGLIRVYNDFATSNPHLKYVDDNGKAFATGRLLCTGPPNQAISSQTPAYTALTNMSIALSPGAYMFRVLIEMKANNAANQWLTELLFSGTATCNYGFRYTSAAGVVGLNANRTAFSSALGGPATSVVDYYWAEMAGYINVTASGNLSVSGSNSAAAVSWNAFQGSFMEAFPNV